MINTKVIDQSIADFDELISFFENKYSNLFESKNQLDAMYWNIEKEGIGDKLVLSMQGSIALLDNELKEIFDAEDLLYNDMKDVMPEQSSVTALKSENESILTLMDSLRSIAANKEELKKQKNLFHYLFLC